MPFAGDKKSMYNREYRSRHPELVQEWLNAHPDAIWRYHRNQCLKRALAHGRPPSQTSIVKYRISQEELQAIADRMISACSSGSVYHKDCVDMSPQLARVK